MALTSFKIWIQVIVIAALAAVALIAYNQIRMPQKPTSITSITSVTVGTTTVKVEVANTEAMREQGLSNRNTLQEGSGMLFVFDRADTYGFWMKDMNFALDMIFADKTGKIITIDKNVSPDTYKKTPPEVFYPTSPAMYVLEVPAGVAQAYGIREGMTMNFR